MIIKECRILTIKDTATGIYTIWIVGELTDGTLKSQLVEVENTRYFKEDIVTVETMRGQEVVITDTEMTGAACMCGWVEDSIGSNWVGAASRLGGLDSCDIHNVAIPHQLTTVTSNAMAQLSKSLIRSPWVPT